jgi:hypothetical protein
MLNQSTPGFSAHSCRKAWLSTAFVDKGREDARGIVLGDTSLRPETPCRVSEQRLPARVIAAGVRTDRMPPLLNIDGRGRL